MTLRNPLKFDLSREEMKKFALLALTLFFIIGTYWLLRPLKDSIFASTVGIKHQPTAKVLSLFVLIPIILGYSKLVDLVPKEKLFYIIVTFYVILFAGISYCMTLPNIGLANTVESPSRIFGWLTYISIESFGSLMVALFWSFTASCTNAESAKKGFPLIIFGAQFGSILGPTIDTYAEEIGMANLMLCACVGIFCIGVMIKIFMIFVGEQENTKSQNSRKPTNQTGMLEGLRLLVTKPYVLGIFCIATFHEIVSTIVDFQMKLTARQTHATPESFASFMGHFGQTVNIITMLMALFGTTYLMQKYGLRFCVILFPVLVGIVLTGIYLNPSINMVFMGMVAIKSLSYGLNNPSKEMMYIPTTKDVKFKAKGWIDTFGSRSSKAGGALINNSLKHSMTALLAYGTIISLGVIAVWIVVAMFVGTKYQTLTDEGKVIGEDGEESIENGVDIGRAQPA